MVHSASDNAQRCTQLCYARHKGDTIWCGSAGITQIMQAGTQAKLDTSDEQAALAVEVEQSLPPLALPVLDHVGFIQDQVFPLLAPEHLCILHANWTTDVSRHSK